MILAPKQEPRPTIGTASSCRSRPKLGEARKKDLSVDVRIGRWIHDRHPHQQPRQTCKVRELFDWSNREMGYFQMAFRSNITIPPSQVRLSSGDIRWTMHNLDLHQFWNVLETDNDTESDIS